MIGSFGNSDRLDTLAQIDALHIANAAHEFFEPALQTEAVAQHEVGGLGFDDVERRRLVFVDLGTGLRDRLDDRLIAGDVLGHVLQNGERGYDALWSGSAAGEVEVPVQPVITASIMAAEAATYTLDRCNMLSVHAFTKSDGNRGRRIGS